jgi:hypothetical protein
MSTHQNKKKLKDLTSVYKILLSNWTWVFDLENLI